MLAIDLDGVKALLSLLQEVNDGHIPDEPTLEAVLAANAFFVNFYSGWDECDREILQQAILHFHQPEQAPAGTLPGRLAEGFRQAVEERDLMWSRIDWLREVDASSIADRVLAFLPEGTPLDATIHITVDLFNNAFVNQNEMGVSLLHGAADRRSFEGSVMHELHHIGFHYWSDQDADRQSLLNEKTGRSIAVMHVQNLLMEGLANFYCTPETVFGEPADKTGKKEPDPYQSRLARLRREEAAFFGKAEAILALCLEQDADYEDCWEAFKVVAFDMEDMMLPAGHYLGARMIQTITEIHPRSRIPECITRLDEFLPLYNEAARKSGGFVFNQRLVEQFNRLLISGT